jgi:hypothetical protein
MKLEGKMVGPWVREFQQAWKTLPTEQSTKKLTIDLCGLLFIDPSGLELLREIYRATGAALITDSPLTKHFAAQATRAISQRKKGE